MMAFLIQLFVPANNCIFRIWLFFHDTVGLPKHWVKKTKQKDSKHHLLHGQRHRVFYRCWLFSWRLWPLDSFVFLLQFKLMETCTCHLETPFCLSPLMDFPFSGNYIFLLVCTLMFLEHIFQYFQKKDIWKWKLWEFVCL